VSRLIVNADDFGLTAGVNRAVVELYRAGVLTSTTLMANAPASEEAIELAHATPALGVGCHVVLVDGEPVLPAGEIPTLIDRGTGRLHQSLISFLMRLFSGRIRSSEIEAEAAAQIGLLQAKGLRLTHVDTHKHTHIFPAVLRPVLRAARRAGIGAVRNPFEPAWAVRATGGAGWARVAEVSLLRKLHSACRKVIEEEGFVTTDGTIAVVGTGILNAEMVRRLLRQLPAGNWELVTHPGYNDADLARVQTRLRASRDVERAALMAIKEFPEIDLGNYADLAGALLPGSDVSPKAASSR
jgi:hopanoid biosynthesis associated protein HpnK